MRVEVVHDVSHGRSSEELDKVRDALIPVAAKIRGVQLARILRGRRAVNLPSVIRAQLDEGDAAAFVAELLDTIRKIVDDDLDAGRSQKYRVDALGEAGPSGVDPTIASETFTLDRGDESEPSRGGEIVAVLATTRGLLDALGARYLELTKAAPALLNANAETLIKLSTALAEANTGHHEWEYKRVELEAKTRLAAQTADWDAFKSRRMWDSFDKYWVDIRPFLEVAAELLGNSAGGSAPTEAEIDTIFGAADPDFAVLSKKFLACRDTGEREALKVALREHFASMSNGAKVVFVQQLQQLDKARLVAIGLWMQRNGIGQNP